MLKLRKQSTRRERERQGRKRRKYFWAPSSEHSHDGNCQKVFNRNSIFELIKVVFCSNMTEWNHHDDDDSHSTGISQRNSPATRSFTATWRRRRLVAVENLENGNEEINLRSHSHCRHAFMIENFQTQSPLSLLPCCEKTRVEKERSWDILQFALNQPCCLWM